MLLFYRMLRVVTLKCLTIEHVHVRKSVVHGGHSDVTANWLIAMHFHLRS